MVKFFKSWLDAAFSVFCRSVALSVVQRGSTRLLKYTVVSIVTSPATPPCGYNQNLHAL